MPAIAAARVVPPIVRPGLRRWARARLEHTGPSGSLWIEGPPGAGKSMLAAASLEAGDDLRVWLQLDARDRDRERLEQDILAAIAAARATLAPAFSASLPPLPATNPGERIAGVLAQLGPCTLVLDAAERVTADGAFHELLVGLATSLPGNAMLLVTSRLPPPCSLARLRMEGRVQHIAAHDLKLDRDEARALALGELPESDAARTEQAWQQSRGWLAGFLAILHQAAGQDPALFDQYLEHELLADLSAEDRALLQTLALTNSVIPVAALEALVGAPGVDRLRELARANRLLEQDEPGFALHPQLADYLQRTGGVGAAQQRSLGDVLAADGRPEAAIDCWLRAGAPEPAAEALVRIAPVLLQRGDHDHLAGYIGALPAALRPAGSRLQLWYGLALAPRDAAAAKPALQAALPALREAGDRSGAALAWAGLVDQAWLEWGTFDHLHRLLDELDPLGPEGIDAIEPAAAAQLVSAALLLFGVIGPGDPRAAGWLAAAETVARQPLPDSERLRVLHVLLVVDTWIYGERPRATRTLEQGRIVQTRATLPPLQEQMWHAAVAGYQLWFEPDAQGARHTVDLALERARQHGMHLWDFQLEALGACAALRRGDGARAQQWLERTRHTTQPAQPTDSSFQAWVCGATLLHTGDPASAATLAEEARRLIAGRGPENAQLLSRLAVARTHRLLGRSRAALAEAIAVDRKARQMDATLYRWMARLTAAQALADCGRATWADRLLAQSLTEGRARGYRWLPWCAPDELDRLCRRGLDLGIDADYLYAFAHGNGLPQWQPPDHAPPDAWPLRMHALGNLAVQGPDGPIPLTGKGATLLRWLAGAGESGIAETRVLDTLWPDAEGDRARRSFDTLLHRLRRKLDSPDAIRLRDQRLVLDPAVCWTDVAALRHHLERAASDDPDAWTAALQLAEQARAPAGEWPEPLGPNLRRQFHRTAEAIIQTHLQAGDIAAAITATQRAAAIDPRHEAFATRLHELTRRAPRAPVDAP
ncbi:MAG: transcriptional regulator, SARP family protein [Pseudomonadota bacterium]